MISCIMPTRDRRRFVAEAIRCFLTQTYTDSELIIVDDGMDRVQDLVPAGGRVRYYHLQMRRTIGEKRNIACSKANGDLIASWDDDDAYHPERLAQQAAVLAANPDAPLTGYHSITFWDERNAQAWHYLNDGHYACGTSFMYRASWWRGHEFLPMDRSEDNTYLRMCGSIPATDGREMCVARIHEGNAANYDKYLAVSANYKRVERTPGWFTA
jgi:glycosyltransferase involved in cell wall biosynthesis